MEYGGSVGTLVAAALETAGYKAQSLVLTDLGDMLSSLGLLFYVGSAISGLITIGLMGQYRAGLWFFIGPGLFYWITGTTVQASGSDWQFGTFQGQDQDVEEVLDNTPTAGSVSWLFNAYNRVVSDFYQNLIGVITDNTVRRQMIFMTRQRIMDRIFSAEIDNPGLKALIHRGLQGQCAAEMQAARAMALGNRDPLYLGTSEYNDWAKYYVTHYGKAKIIFQSGMPDYDYLVDMIKAVQQANSNSSYDLDCGKPELNAFVTKDPRVALQDPVSCEQVWCWSGIGVAWEAKHLQKDAENRFISEYAQTEDPTLYEEIWANIATKLSKPSLGQPVQDPASMVPVIIGGILLRKTMTTDPRSQMFSDLADNSGIYTKPYDFNLKLTTPQLQDVLQKMNQHQQAASLQYETYTFAMTLPYIQGIILYALAIAFPFFAVMVLIPGKASAFFTWMALWAWAKSWDVGFGIVMVIDDILWNLMPHNSVFDPSQDANHGPITIFESAFQSDPSYSLATYYGMLSVLLISVPMVSANVVMGSKKAVAGILIDGMKKMSQGIGGSVADWVAHDQITRINYLREEFVRSEVVKAVEAEEAAEREMLAQQQKYQQQEAAGESKSVWGWIIGGAAIVAGSVIVATTFWTGVGGVAGAALIATGVGVAAGGTAVGYSTWKGGINEQRSANESMIDWRYRNAELHRFATNYTTEVRNLDAIRAGLSNRGEFWNLVDTPSGIPGAKEMIEAKNNAAIGRAMGEMWAGIARGAADGVELGIDTFKRGR